MANLIVIAFDEQDEAAEVRKAMRELQLVHVGCAF